MYENTVQWDNIDNFSQLNDDFTFYFVYKIVCSRNKIQNGCFTSTLKNINN